MRPFRVIFLSVTLPVVCVAFAQKPAGYSPGQIVPDSYLRQHGADRFFSSQSLPDSIFRLMQGKTYSHGCTIPRDSLRYLLCLHRDASHKAFIGEMVVNFRIAQIVLGIFRQLFDAGYPIERMRLPDYWNAVDEAQMQADNTSGFNYRPIAGRGKLSLHSQGLAVDINTLYNPCFKPASNAKGYQPGTLQPRTAQAYTNRQKSFPYKIQKGDLCYRLFTSHGFRWGGDWRTKKDYQHFELR